MLNILQVLLFSNMFLVLEQNSLFVKYNGRSFAPHERHILINIVTSGSTDLKSVVCNRSVKPILDQCLQGPCFKYRTAAVLLVIM